MSHAAYQFFPWVKRGAGVGIGPVDSGGALPGRVPVEVGVEVTGGSVAQTSMQIYGPGDVIGIDPNQIVRTEPVADSTDFEPNYFVHLEFAEAALPWLFTPATADTVTDRLRPWCVLVVVAAQEGVEVGPGKVLEVLEIRAPADASRELPDLAESWAWTHAQVVAEEDGSPQLALAGDDRLSLARLLCPRRLEPLTSYHACLVPAFGAGVTAGLGEAVDVSAPLLPAWGSGLDAPTQIRLPVYHHWEFATGPIGDFESLVRRLEPGPVPDGVGRRSMYIGSAGSGMPELAPADTGAVVGLEGALRPVEQEREVMPEPPRNEVEAVLQRLADAGAARRDEEDTETGPLGAPLYGAWQAQKHRIDDSPDAPPWLRSLNSDPRDRAAAAAGMRAVQANQEDLVHSAWEQLGAVDTANQRLRVTGLARAVARSLHRRHFAAMAPAALVQMMGPSSSRLLVDDTSTLAAEARRSLVAAAALRPNFRRAIRPTTRIRRSGETEPSIRSDSVARLNSGALEPKPARTAPDGAVLADGMNDLRVQGRIAVVPGAGGVEVPAAFAAVLAQLANADTKRGESDANIPHLPQEFTLIREVDVLAMVAAGASGIVIAQGRPQLSVGEPSLQRLPVVPLARDVFNDLMRRRIQVGLPIDLQVSRPPQVIDPRAPRRYESAIRSTRRLFTKMAADPTLPSMDMAAVAARALSVTDPNRRAVLRTLTRIAMPGDIRRPPDPLAPIRGAPVFPVPLVELIGAVDREYVLPGLHLVEANTVGLVEANRRFIEAAMVGANHEMGRELKWRRYPVERNSTFFKRFWNRPPDNFDIPPIADWPAQNDLGANAFGSPEGELILLIRGDLLRRYPGTIIYAARAEFSGSRRILVEPPDEVHPVLSASLPPDVAMRGFPLTVKEVVGNETSAGWFFVIASQPTEPRFGLDVAESSPLPPTNRKDLNWAHMAQDGDLTSVSHATVGALANLELGPLRWGTDAASQAAITLQDPVRIVIHARHLLGQVDA